MRFFFYGTLMTSRNPQARLPFMRRGRSLGFGRVRGRSYALATYPAGVFDPDGPDTFRGEVLEFSDDSEVIVRLDAYEEFEPHDPSASLFVRREFSVTMDDGRVLPCWMYAYNRDVSGPHPLSRTATSPVGGRQSPSRAGAIRHRPIGGLHPPYEERRLPFASGLAFHGSSGQECFG